MNLVINDMDQPLIIKVASVPKERLQVYFIDNEEYFRGRGLEKDEASGLYPDTDERAIFFAKGVLETVKKLNWSPDIVHVNGRCVTYCLCISRRNTKTTPLLPTRKW